MKKLTLIVLLIAAMASCLSFAQTRGTTGNNQIEAKRMAWQSWRLNHPHVLSLQHTVLTLANLQDSPLLKSDSKQASAILAIFEQSGAKTKLSDKQAKKLDQEMQALLSDPQINAIKEAPRLYTSPPRPKPMGLPGSGKPTLSPESLPWPRDYNPLNPGTAPFPIQRAEMLVAIKKFKTKLQATAANSSQ